MKINDNGTDRDMTEEELAAHKEWATIAKKEQAAIDAAAVAQAAARVSALTKLAELGLTNDEIAALVG
jgi:hypothetical protein